ncbi:hypothetical protein C8R43DRAFT_979895 [Mycena crocata]|nr:hypothetical protein C8R43DRAFT_979895 [Mycena crocata]
MPTKKPAVRTLYTARFYETPSSSESTHHSSSKPQQPSNHMEKLFHTHVALNQMEEVPDSRPNTPHKVDVERVERLKKQVVEAFAAANGNPSSGKWGIITNLLQTGTAQAKYRYLETDTNAVPPTPGPEGWILAETEEEWFEWERKRNEAKLVTRDRQRTEEQLLKEKVETWKRDVHSDPLDVIPLPSLDDPNGEPTSIGNRAQLTKIAPLGDVKPLSKVGSASKSRARSIAELPETAFLPPSFPNHLETSTPPAAARRYKPSPIELVPSSSPISPSKRRLSVSPPVRIKSPTSPPKFSSAEDVPSSSPLSSPPKNSRVYGRPRPSESPLKRRRSSSPTPNLVKKNRPSSPGPASSSALPTPPPLVKAAFSTPFTPTRNGLPRLEDLVAASAQKQKSKTKSKEREKQKVKGKAKAVHSSKPKAEPTSPPSLGSQSSQIQEAQEQFDLDPAEAKRRLDIEEAIDGIEQDVMNWGPVDKMPEYGATSPSKSLSSIADSNSLESHNGVPDFSNDAVFEPQGASTQPMGHLANGESQSTGLGTTQRSGRGYGQPVDLFPMRYESQMDVESNMQGVEQLLNEDVGRFTTSPWMGAGPDDDEDEQFGRGQPDSSP